MTDEPVVKLHNLKRRRGRERANATRFSALLDGFDDSTSLDDFEHYRGRLQETLERLISLDDAIHDLLSDNEYEEDIKVCEEYTDKTKRAIQKASRRMDNVLSASTARLNIQGQLSQPQPSLLFRSHIRRSFPLLKLSPSRVMSRIGLDFGSSSDPPLTKTLRSRLLRSMFSSEDTWRGSQKCWWTE
jgi:hypothetical protein